MKITHRNPTAAWFRVPESATIDPGYAGSGGAAVTTLPLDAITAETETLTAAWHAPRRSRWRAWRARRRAVTAAMDAGYRLSPAAYAHLRRTA